MDADASAHVHLKSVRGGQEGFHLDHHYHCHGEDGGPRRARRATAVGQSISRQSVAVERPSATKDGQEMARDGEARRESTMITPGTPRATLRAPLTSRHLNSCRVLKCCKQSYRVSQCFEV